MVLVDRGEQMTGINISFSFWDDKHLFSCETEKQAIALLK